MRLHYQRNPIDWIVDRLGIRREQIDWELLPQYAGHAWDGTRNPFRVMFEAIADEKWVGIESGTGLSKTFLGACTVLWFLEAFEDALVVTTAPKEKQLSLNIWKEIGRLHAKFGRGKLLSGMLRMNPPSDDWMATAFTAGVRAE